MARRRIDPSEPIACPFTIIADQREKDFFRYTFGKLRADADQKYRPLTVAVEVGHLTTGDYSIKGHESRVAIERKSLGDLYATLAQGRERFTAELARLAMLDLAAVVVEAEWSEILASPPPRCELPPKNVYRSVLAYMVKWPSIHWLMVPGRGLAETTTFRLLQKWWERQETRG